MIKKLNDRTIEENIGNKAKNLQILSQNNFNVPNGIVINNDILDNIDDYAKEIAENIDENKKYAVRSSGHKEDTDNLSFAGLYNSYLNIKGKEQVIENIKKCYNSRLSEKNIEYCKNNNIDTSNLEMSVIVQEMVDADISGIAFTINPITGNDKEIVIEITKGLGEKNASGNAKPEKYVYNWYKESNLVQFGDGVHKKTKRLAKKKSLKRINKSVIKHTSAIWLPCRCGICNKKQQNILFTSAPYNKNNV